MGSQAKFGESVVTLGGGHGQATLLQALRLMDVAPTAIAAVSDEGGCSGIIRREIGIAPPGDARRCLAALSGHPERARAFCRRAPDESGEERSVGNLMLANLAAERGSLEEAVVLAGRWLECRGRVLPAARAPVTLHASDVGGARYTGELAISAALRRIARLEADPVDPNLDAVLAVHRADVVIIGPGSFYTSVLSALSTPGIARALVSGRASVLWIANLAPEGAQTSGMALRDYTTTLREHIHRWAGEPLRRLTVLAHGERYTESAIDPLTSLYRAPIAPPRSARHAPGALARALVRHELVRVPLERRDTLRRAA